MKKLLTTIMCASTLFSAKAADIYVNNSGQPGTWPTITLALAAAAPNDRIFVSPYGDYTENLTIYQNVTLTSAVSGTSFNVVGTITVQGAPNMDVKIIGANASGSFTAQTGGASLLNQANVYLIESIFSAVTGEDFIQMHVLFCDMPTRTCSIKHGEIRGCEFSQITINDGPNAGVPDTLFIVGNIIGGSTGGYLQWSNDDQYFVIRNNYIPQTDNQWCIRILNHHYNTLIGNLIENNTVVNGGASPSYLVPLYVNTPSNKDNIIVRNNILQNTGTNASYSKAIYATGAGGGTVQCYYNYLDRASNETNATLVVGNTIGGALTFDLEGRSTDAAAVDAGSPSLQYYDIDMTRNDIGTFGGPWSIDNYVSAGTGNARVYNLTMPFEIWSGQTPSVEAESTHTK